MKIKQLSSDSTDKLSIFWSIISNTFPPIGFYLFFKNRKQFPKKAKTALTNALLGIPVGLIGGFILQNFISKLV